MKKATFFLSFLVLTSLHAEDPLPSDLPLASPELMYTTSSASPFGDPAVPVSADISALDPHAKAQQDFAACTGPLGLNCESYKAPEKCAAACSKAIFNFTGISVLPPNYGQPVSDPNKEYSELVFLLFAMADKSNDLDLKAPAEEPAVSLSSESSDEKGKGKKEKKKGGK